MAYITEKVGVYSELMAEAALMAAGYIGVSRPTTNEYYDLTALDRFTREHKTFQVKTIVRRDKNENGVKDDLVVFATKGNGKRYSDVEACDYYVAVLADDGVVPRVFLIENRGLREYWMKEAKASERWVELPIALDRGTLTDEIAPVVERGA